MIINSNYKCGDIPITVLCVTVRNCENDCVIVLKIGLKTVNTQ